MVLNVNDLISIGDYQFYSVDGNHYLANYVGDSCELILPDSYNGENYRISDCAFYGCGSLTSITIPDSVTSIGDGAFRTCNSLREVVFEDGGNTLSLGINSYDNEGLFYDCPLVSVYLGRNLTYDTSSDCGYSPFYNTKTLTSVIIGDSVTSIGSYAFSGCSSLTSITIPECVTSIGNNAFSGCSGLTSITIPESVTSIGSYAFEKCSGLHLVIISSPLTSIGSQAFSGCSPEKVVWLCNTPPQGHSSLNGMVNYVPNEQYKGKDNVVVYPYLSSFFKVDGMMFVPVSPSERTCDLITYSYDSIMMNRLAIPEKVQFKGIGMNIKSVGPYAFCNTNITELDIEKGVSAISSTAFLNCSKLAKITVSDENATFDSRNDCSAIIEKENSKLVQGCINTVIPQDVKIIGDYAFYNCTELNDIELPNDIASIGNYAFYNCDSLNVNLVLDKVESIGDNAFYGCGNIANISIGHRVSSIGEKAFNDCIGLASVSLNCSNIGDWFNGSTSIEEVVLGDSVVSIGQNAFKNCSSLASINIPESVTSVGSSAFYGCSSLASINIPENVTSTGNNTFKDCKGLTDVVIAERKQGKTLALGNYVFANCPLDSVYIGGAISYNTSSSNGYSPFYRNTSLRTVVITNREEQIYDYEFYGCTNLKNVTIGNGVKSIGKYAFSGCSSLTGFSFGSNMETIDTEAFSDCTKLTSITSYAAAPPTCGSQALDDVNKWECVLRVPIGYTAAYQAADQWKDFFFVEDVVELERYVLTYMVDGEVYYTDTLVHKETMTHPKAPVKEGYTFSGWDKTLTAMPAEDATINGAFIINKYLVTFKIGDEVIAADSLEYGAAIVAPEAPEKEGHTFAGWGEVAETVPAGDVTYEGTYTVNVYNVYYYVGEELVHTAEVTYGEAIPEYVYEPTEEGYTFLGWIGDTYETMPAHDVTYMANIDDAINNLMIDNEQLTIYDLQGRKVDAHDIKDLSKGIYIINGKQVLIK